MTRYDEGGSATSRHDVVVDLDYLTSIGQVLLPALANDYATLNHMAADTDSQGTPLFAWSPGVSGTSTPNGYYQSTSSQTGDQWSALCELLQNSFGHSATNLQDAGTTVLAIEEHYETTDHVSATELKNVWDGEIWPQDQGFNTSYPRVQVTVTDQP